VAQPIRAMSVSQTLSRSILFLHVQHKPCYARLGAIFQTRSSAALAIPSARALQPADSRFADATRIPHMSSSELAKLCQAAASEGADSSLWDAIAAQCQARADLFRCPDTVKILSSFTAARVEHRQVFLRLAESLCAKASFLAPAHILDILAAYEANGLRPRALYVELFHAMIRLARSMFAEEISLTLQALARHRLGNPSVLVHMVHAVRRQLKEFRLRYLCGTAGALGELQVCPPSLLLELDAQARFDIETVPAQELFDNLQSFPLLEYSWRPYEEMCMHELVHRVTCFQTAADVDQFVNPFEVFYFLQLRGILQPQFVEALCQWCLTCVHKPNVLSQRRPNSEQLIELYDRCREMDLQNMVALNDALHYFVESAGGKWDPQLPQPLKYKSKSRRGVRSVDPLEGHELPPLPSYTAQFSESEIQVQGTAQESIEPSMWSGDKTLQSTQPRRRPLSERCFVKSRKGARPRTKLFPGKELVPGPRFKGRSEMFLSPYSRAGEKLPIRYLRK